MGKKPIERFRVQTFVKSRVRLALGSSSKSPHHASHPADSPATQADSLVANVVSPTATSTTTLATNAAIEKPVERSIEKPVEKSEPPIELPVEASVAETIADSTHSSSDSNPPANPATPLPPTDDQPPSDRLTSDRPKLKSQLRHGLRGLGMPLVWLIVLAFCGGTGVSALLWLTTLPPLPNCDRLHPFLSSDVDKLYCAEQAVKSGRAEALVTGIKLIKPWSAEHPLYNRSKRLLKDWSAVLLKAAQNKAGQDDLKGAIDLAKAIPSNSPSYKNAQSAIVSWQKASKEAQRIEATIMAALKAQDWKQAETQLQALDKEEGEYWQQRENRLRQQLITEQIARRQLQQVQRAGTPTDATSLKQLVDLAEQISPDTYAHAEAETELKRLGQALATVAEKQLAQGDVNGAIATAQVFPVSVEPSPLTQDLIWLGRAQPLMVTTVSAVPIGDRLVGLWTVLPQLRQIKPESPVYTQAQTLLVKLEMHLQDLTQLQLAQSMARVAQVPAFQAAIALAEDIGRDRPQRLLAQTLIAQWRQDIVRAEDRPYLLAAQQLAAEKTVPKLKAAIAQARKIALDRPLRKEAQSAIFEWSQAIQKLEDSPILQQAQTLAKQKKLAEAIQTANKIPANRALFADAQKSIENWTVQLQTAEDRPILNQANSLADQGSLGAAIDLAYQIAPGRALYAEAQEAIARWESLRAPRRPNRDSREDSDSNSPDRQATAPEAPPR